MLLFALKLSKVLIWEDQLLFMLSDASLDLLLLIISNQTELHLIQITAQATILKLLL